MRKVKRIAILVTAILLVYLPVGFLLACGSPATYPVGEWLLQFGSSNNNVGVAEVAVDTEDMENIKRLLERGVEVYY